MLSESSSNDDININLKRRSVMGKGASQTLSFNHANWEQTVQNFVAT